MTIEEAKAVKPFFREKIAWSEVRSTITTYDISMDPHAID